MPRKLKKRVFLYVFVLIIGTFFAACNDLEHSAARLQKQLDVQEDRALVLADQLATALDGESFDSIWQITHAEQDILFYIFKY